MKKIQAEQIVLEKDPTPYEQNSKVSLDAEKDQSQFLGVRIKPKPPKESGIGFADNDGTDADEKAIKKLKQGSFLVDYSDGGSSSDSQSESAK